MDAVGLVEAVKRGEPLSAAALAMHRADKHLGEGPATCLRCEHITDQAFRIDAEAMDTALIADAQALGIDLLAMVAEYEGGC